MDHSTRKLKVRWTKEMSVDLINWHGDAMDLPEERWKEEEVVRLSIRWRNSRRKVHEVFTAGACATELWKGLHYHLGDRMRALLDMEVTGKDPGSVALESGEKVLLADIDTLWIEDGEGHEFIFERYGSESIPTPTEHTEADGRGY